MADRIDHDSPWKETLDRFLRPFLELTFPKVCRRIDWSVEPVSLEQELRAIMPGSDLGPLRADKLIKVRLVDGTDRWLLIHIEVQMQHDPDLPRRIFDYCCRIHSCYDLPVMPLVILGDDRRDWRPCRYFGGFADHGLSLRFAICKISDLQRRLNHPRHRNNQAIFIIAAHLGTRQHRKDPEKLADCRLELTRKLYALGHRFTPDDLWHIQRLIDWLMPLPQALKVSFKKRVHQLQPPKSMPHITLFEELSREEGRQEGRQEGLQEGLQQGLQASILEILEARFNEVPGAVREQILACSDVAQLKQRLRRASVISNLPEF